MIVRELVTLLGFKLEESKLKAYEDGMQKAVKATKWAAAGASLLGGAMLYAAGTAEQNQVAFEVMLGSAEKARNMLSEINTFAAKTPFGQMDLIENAKLMLNFGIAAEDVMDNLQMLGDVAGGDKEKLQGLTLAFAQVSSAGKLQGQDLLQMINAGFNPLKIISEKTGKSMGQLRDEMSKGLITADMMKQAFKDVTSEGGMFYRMMEKQSKTLFGRWSTFLDTLMMMGVVIGQQLSPYAGDLLDEFSGFLDTYGDAIKGGLTAFFTGLAYVIGYVVVIVEALLDEFGGFDVVVGAIIGTLGFFMGIVQTVVGVLWDLRELIAFVVAGMILYNVYAKIMAMWAARQAIFMGVLNAVMALNPVGAIVVGFIALAAVGVLIYKNWNKVVALFKRLWKGFTELKLVKAALSGLSTFLDAHILAWKKFVEMISGSELFQMIVKGISKIVNYLKDKFGFITEVFDKISAYLSENSTITGTVSGAAVSPYLPVNSSQLSRAYPAQNSLNVSSNISVSVPEGTQESQKTFLNNAAKSAVRSEWDTIMRQARAANPNPLGAGANY